jgi:FkbM family methyltransferase
MNCFTAELDDIFLKRAASAPQSIEEMFKKLNGKHIVLYGAGAFGSENCELFNKYGIIPEMFLDKNAREGAKKMGIPVLRPDDKSLPESFRRNCIVYISIVVPKKIMTAIKQDLANWGYSNCEEVQKITARKVKFDGVNEENPNDEYFKNNKEKIYRALELMNDEESHITYISCVRAHLLRDYGCCHETDFAVQYFDAGVPYSKGLSHFVDCGAYTGDSLETALKFSDIELYVGFEPITSNFSALSDTVDKLHARVKNAFLFPCGVAEKTGSASFSVSASSSAITDKPEGVTLPLICLDDALKNIPVTFLKMDIEGAEPDALKGAKTLITTQKPELAISVYHAVNHFWDIPNLLFDLNPDYKFYLRTHTSATLESVLYATLE